MQYLIHIYLGAPYSKDIDCLKSAGKEVKVVNLRTSSYKNVKKMLEAFLLKGMPNDLKIIEESLKDRNEKMGNLSVWDQDKAI